MLCLCVIVIQGTNLEYRTAITLCNALTCPKIWIVSLIYLFYFIFGSAFVGDLAFFSFIYLCFVGFCIDLVLYCIVLLFCFCLPFGCLQAFLFVS